MIASLQRLNYELWLQATPERQPHPCTFQEKQPGEGNTNSSTMKAGARAEAMFTVILAAFAVAPECECAVQTEGLLMAQLCVEKD